MPQQILPCFLTRKHNAIIPRGISHQYVSRNAVSEFIEITSFACIDGSGSEKDTERGNGE